MKDNTVNGSPTSGYPSSCGGAPADAVTPCKAGFINRSGQFAIEPRFEAAQDFAEGLAAVELDTRSHWGFIDTKGKLIIPAIYDEMQQFSDSLALVRLNSKYLYLDHTGKTALRVPYEEATSFVQGLAAVLMRPNHVGYINHSGKVIFEYDRK